MNAKQKTVNSDSQRPSVKLADAFVCHQKLVKSSAKPVVAKTTKTNSRKRHFDFVGLAG